MPFIIQGGRVKIYKEDPKYIRTPWKPDEKGDPLNSLSRPKQCPRQLLPGPSVLLNLQPPLLARPQPASGPGSADPSPALAPEALQTGRAVPTTPGARLLAKEETRS